MRIILRFGYLFSLFVLFLLFFIRYVEANHGAGTSGTAITIPAITLKKRHVFVRFKNRID